MNTIFDLDTTFSLFIRTVKSFDAATFAQKPVVDSWSAAEVAEHIWIINNNLIRVLQAPGEAADRPADKKLPTIIAALQDRETKRVAPENVIPTGKHTEPAFLIGALQQQQEQLQQIAKDKDLQELCTVYPHPRLGRLTRLEWFHFIVWHTERHRQQLIQIAGELEV